YDGSDRSLTGNLLPCSDSHEPDTNDIIPCSVNSAPSLSVPLLSSITTADPLTATPVLNTRPRLAYNSLSDTRNAELLDAVSCTPAYNESSPPSTRASSAMPLLSSFFFFFFFCSSCLYGYYSNGTAINRTP
ncbi:proteophosphoglycan ppg4, partial [Trypanosoma theileri]